MPRKLSFVSLMLFVFFISLFPPIIGALNHYGHPNGLHHHHIGHWRLAGRDQPPQTFPIARSSTAHSCVGTDCIESNTLSPDAYCNDTNNSSMIFNSNNMTWVMLCNIDFFAQDIFPFLLVPTFEDCLHKCGEYNFQNGIGTCAGFVFAPDRINSDNDCYLKSSVNDVVQPSTIHLLGATLISEPSSTVDPHLIKVQPTQTTENEDVQGDDILQVPQVANLKLLGASVNEPSTRYVVHKPALPKKISKALLQPGINIDLVTRYPLAPDTGTWTSASSIFQLEVANMSIKPRLSRDGGRGGQVNGTHIFVFCDTATFGEEETENMGFMNGFVSSSAAVFEENNAFELDRLVLRDMVGGWQDDVGRLRGFIEMTTGEEAFNIEISGDGFRYAVWPDSSFIPLNTTHSLIYAPVVYVEVNMTTQKAVFYSLGNSLVAISVDPIYGPHSDRLVNLLFQEPEVEWGSLGGLRAWGLTGNGTMDGMIYLFGQVEKGVLVAKVSARSALDRSQYQYWNGNSWTISMPDRNSTAYLVEEPVMNFDIFYTPFYQYFIMVYMKPNADNTFWYRALLTPKLAPIIPPYMPGGQDDYCERILQYNWSEPMILFKIDPPPKIGYAYAGGVHAGFFGADDLANGGTRILLTWTEHTDKDPMDPASGYVHKSAWVAFGKRD